MYQLAQIQVSALGHMAKSSSVFSLWEKMAVLKRRYMRGVQ